MKFPQIFILFILVCIIVTSCIQGEARTGIDPSRKKEPTIRFRPLESSPEKKNIPQIKDTAPAQKAKKNRTMKAQDTLRPRLAMLSDVGQ